MLAAAIEEARVSGKQRIEWLARVEHAFVQIYLDPEGKTEAARIVAERAVAILEGFRDAAGLARAWELINVVHWLVAKVGAAGDAVDRGLAYARRAGDEEAETRLLQWTLSCDRFGPRPVAEALRRSEEILAAAGGNRLLEADARGHRGIALAASGRFEEARAMIRESQAIVSDLGLRGTLEDMTSWHIGIIESLASDFAAAERSLLEQYVAFEKMGERSHLSTVAGELARLMCELGRFEEAERFARVCEEFAASDDIASQVLWRSGRGRALSRRGDPETAESFAREAVSMSMQTDSLEMQADAKMDLGDVLQAVGRPDGCVPVVRDAIELYRRKGIVPKVARAEAALTGTGGSG